MHKQKSVNRLLRKLDTILPANNVKISDILEILNKAFKRQAITFIHNVDKTLRKGDFSIGGCLHENDDRCHIDIELNTRSERTLDFDRVGYEDLFFNLSQTIQHELIHKLQLQMRGKELHTHRSIQFIQGMNDKMTNEETREYYSIPTEIEAHAHDITLELTRSLGPNIEKWRDKLENQTFLQKNSGTYLSYARTFKSWRTHKINKQLMKHVMRFLNHGVCWKA